MRYVTMDELEKYAGDEAFEQLVKRFSDDEDRVESALSECETRMLAYIIPNTPCADQIAAFARAVCMQFLYEQDPRNAQLADMPDHVRSFTVNGFSASLDSSGSAFSPYGMSKTAKAELALCGLLYRGVSCSC